MRSPLITLTTDFGLADHFVGAMKGVILGIAPSARIVDITHEVSAWEISEAAFVISEACRYFPRGTVHVVVVDPGVGTARRPILVEAAGQYFLGPDNGVLSMVYGAMPHKVRHLTARKYFLKIVSQTFHGRDVFAPAAAHLARGVKPAQMGKLIQDYLKTELAKPERTGKRLWAGKVLKKDRFGNLITSFHSIEFPDILRRPFVLNVGLESVTKVANTYAEGAPGELLLMVGSSGYYEVALNQDSAARRLGITSGSPVELTQY